MKKTGRCPKCNHNRLLHIPQVADRVGEVGTRLDSDLPSFEVGAFQAWRLAWVRNPRAGFLSSHDGAVGLVEAWICPRCELTELYTKGAAELPIDGEYVREIVGPEGEGPFR